MGKLVVAIMLGLIDESLILIFLVFFKCITLLYQHNFRIFSCFLLVPWHDGIFLKFFTRFGLLSSYLRALEKLDALICLYY